MKHPLLALGLVVAGLSASGADYYLKTGGGAIAWNEAASFCTDAARTTESTVVPGASDTVWVAAGDVVDFDTTTTAGQASFSAFAGVYRVKPGNGTKLRVTVGENVTNHITAAICYDGEVTYSWQSTARGQIVKLGPGALCLDTAGRVRFGGGSTGTCSDYFTGLDIQAGTVYLPQAAPEHCYFGDVTMAAGTTLVTVSGGNSSDGRFTYVASLNGDGDIRNESGRSSGQSFGPVSGRSRKSVFAGTLHHAAKWWFAGNLTLTGTMSDVSLPVVVEGNAGHGNDGTDYGVLSFVNYASLGYNAMFEPYGNGACLHYLGTTDIDFNKIITNYTQGYPFFIDAGAYGGISFNGTIGAYGDNAAKSGQKTIVLTGSNTTACVIKGEVTDNAYTAANNPSRRMYTTYFRKNGTGTWRFANTRTHGGGFWIEDGTLQFDSIAEKGTACALGVATNLTAIGMGQSVTEVDYAYLLGGTTASQHPVMEYTGTTDGEAYTRPLALKNAGGALKNDTSYALHFGPVSVADASASTLTLTGSSTADNVLANAQDGSGTLSVVKEGTGRWILGRNQSFSGSLHVKEGTLELQNPSADFKWFRVTIKGTVSSSTTVIQMREFCLYDEDGVRQNIGLTLAGVNTGYASGYSPAVVVKPLDLQPGEVAWNTAFSYKKNTSSDKPQSCDLDGLFGNVFSTQSTPNQLAIGIQTTPVVSKPATWLTFTMRLNAEAHKITHFDLQTLSDASSNGGWFRYLMIEGSANGLDWTTLFDNADTGFDYTVGYLTYKASSGKCCYCGETASNKASGCTVSPNGLHSSGWGAAQGVNCWLSTGLAVTAADKNSRPYIDGSNWLMNASAAAPTYAVLDNAATVRVDAGATLKTVNALTLSKVTLDAAGNGTFNGFTFADAGTLDVVGTGTLTPIGATFTNCTGLANLANWSLTRAGEGTRRGRIAVREGAVQVLLPGTMLLFR